MILSDYFLCEESRQWHFAKQMGVQNAVIRLPEDSGFDLTDRKHWDQACKKLIDFGIKPVAIEPMPNCVHEHIKQGDSHRDESILKVLKMFPIMDALDIRTICFNWMAHIGWLRTASDIKERGGALVTGFDIEAFQPQDDFSISEETLWDNYEYFIRIAVPEAEKYGIRLALHPDDPPLSKLGGVSRIMTSYQNINRAVNLVDSPSLGVTMCQATFSVMGEDLYSVIPAFAEQKKIFMVHFRDYVGNKMKFHESFHDNGQTNMADILWLYENHGVDVPIRVDHVPLMAGEKEGNFGYTDLGRLFAIGYLKGLLDAIQ